PAGASGGSVFTTQPVFQVQDGDGNLEAAATNAVTVAIKSGTGASGAVLSGTLTVRAVGGVATFAALKIDKAGSGYVLTATASGLAPVDSAPFTVAVGPATQLIVATQPGGAITGGPLFTSQPVVRIADAGANTVPTAIDAITLAIKAGT